MRHPRRNFHAAIWLIGIGILALTHYWWPGILILVGISMVMGALMRGEAQPDWPATPSTPPQFYPPAQPYSPPPAPPSPVYQPPAPLYPVTPAPAPLGNLNWVPARCDSCGGPLSVSGLKVLDSHTVVCPFCGTKISRAG